jgi:hypothetical protein
LLHCFTGVGTGAQHMAAARTTDLLISALGGALGALILRSLLKTLGAVWARLRPLAVHQCATSGTRPGEFDHCWGREVEDKASMNGKAWEHDANKVARHPPHEPMGQHTVFGPYVNDFGRPGFYRIAFSIRGMNIPKSNNDALIALDVVQSSFGTERTLRLLGQRIVKANELSRSYRHFAIICYASGTDVYEYRCAILPNPDAVTANIGIRFDCVKVYSHPSILDLI